MDNIFFETSKFANYITSPSFNDAFDHDAQLIMTLIQNFKKKNVKP